MELEGLLKSKGWTDADLESVKPLLENPRFRSSMEEQFGAVEAERDSFKARDAEWQRRLDEDYNPRMTAAEKEAQAARLSLAEANEKLKIARDYGYLPGDAEAKAEAAAAAARVQAADGYDPKKHPSWEDVNKFADAEGEAMAIVNDLSAEYSQLTGKTLFEYEGQNGSRGLRALRAESKSARKPLDVYVAEKFDFAGKRAAMTAARQKEHDDAIRKEAAEQTRSELAQQYGNPMLRTALPSSSPFIPRRAGSDKPAWDRGTAQERRSERLTRAIEIQSKGAVQ